MKLNSKEVKNKVYNHIKDEFDDLEYEGCETLQEKIKKQVDDMQFKNETVYKTGFRMVEGGMFLWLNEDILEFIQGLNLNNNSNKKFDMNDTFKLYCHILAKMIESIYESNYKAK